MRFLATGDLQCGNWKQFNVLQSDGLGSRLHQCLNIFRLLHKEAKKRGINKILLNGDIFEKNGVLEVEVFDAVYKEVERMYLAGLTVVMNIGNHDVTRTSPDHLPALHSLRIFNRVARVIETPRIVWDRLCIVPWMADPKALISQVKDIAKNWALPHNPLLALHAGVSGAIAGTGQSLSGAIRLEDLYPERFKLLLLSDYHHPQWIGKNSFYLGSPLQHSFGETHTACVWEVVLNEGSAGVWAIPTHAPRFHWVSAKRMSDARSYFKKYPKDYFRVQILPSKKKIDSSDLQKLANHYGCLVQVENAPVYDKGPTQLANIAEGMDQTLRDYVKKSAPGKSAQYRLWKLGKHILNSV